jgi:serine protease Do
MGIISAKGRSLGGAIERYEDFIQTDAAINRGNSGGALIDTRGELVGINTAILSGSSGGNEGVGFAIPANLARSMMDQILKHGKVTRGYMGILPQELTPDMAKAFNMPNGRGVAVAQVESDSPAAKAGLKVGDVITAINGNAVEDVNEFRLDVAAFAPGTTVRLKINRNGQTMDLPVTLSEYNMEAAQNSGGQPVVPEGGEKGALQGVSVQAITSDVRQELQLPSNASGVVITDVDPSSRAAQAGLEQGMVITQVNHKPVTTVAEFNAAIRAGASRETTLLLVRIGAATQFVVVQNR